MYFKECEGKVQRRNKHSFGSVSLYLDYNKNIKYNQHSKMIELKCEISNSSILKVSINTFQNNKLWN